MWELDCEEGWAPKNWCFWLCCWRRHLRVPLTARRSNQSILKEISPECSLEGLMLKLKFQYFGHLMQRTNSLEKTLMLGKIEGGRRRGWQRMRWLDGITNTMDMGLGDSESWWWIGRPGMLQSMGSQRLGHDWATELNWTDGWWNNGYFLFWILSDELLFIFFYVFHSFKYSLMSKHYFLKKKCYKLWTNWKESLSTAS